MTARVLSSQALIMETMPIATGMCFDRPGPEVSVPVISPLMSRLMNFKSQQVTLTHLGSRSMTLIVMAFLTL